jgi:hypothetical protein
MDSLESRMERLTPEQRREVEDFIDFLLLKNNFLQTPGTVSSPPPVMMNAPPVLSVDTTPSTTPVRMQDLVIRDDSLPQVTPEPSPLQEIVSNSDDGITRDYVDYGKFEQASSPATEAVKKVKKKLIAREAEDTSRHLLDWVD